MASIIQSEKECYICGQQYGLENHHCIHGVANRKIADKHGLTVWLCNFHHRELHDRNHNLDLFMQQTAQTVWEEKRGTREEWIKLFGKSYL